MKTFKVSNKLEIVCEAKKTRNGFKHEATLLKNGQEVDKTKICYLNRTWEAFEFESVIKQLLDKTNLLTEDQKTNFLKEASELTHKETKNSFGLIGSIAMMGDILCTDKKSKNDWKARMLKAGLENQGLKIPNDWDQLNENDKESRLNNVIAELQN